MPKRRPFGPPNWQIKKELMTKTKVLSVAIAAAKAMIAVGIKKTDTVRNADFNIGLNGMVGLVAVAAAVPEVLNEDR